MAEVRARGWCFTLNNYTDEDLIHCEKIKCRYVVIGKEVGEKEGTPHLQGYYYWDSAKKWRQVKEIMPTNARFFKAKGSPKANKAYCSKENIWLERGVKPAQGDRSDMKVMYDMIADGGCIRDIIDAQLTGQALRSAEIVLKYTERPRKERPEVLWFWGPPGTGKTEAALAETKDPWVSGKSLKWWEGYDAHEHVIIDDFREDFCSFPELLRITDKLQFRVEYKGGSRQLLAKKIIITTPHPPERSFPSSREHLWQLMRRISEVREFGDKEQAPLEHNSPGVIVGPGLARTEPLDDDDFDCVMRDYSDRFMLSQSET